MKRIYMWGTGKVAEYIYHCYKKSLDCYNVIGFIDNDKSKEGKKFHGKRIFQPSVLNHDRDCRIIILTMAYREIEQEILERYPWMEGRTEPPLLFTKNRLVSRYGNTEDAEIKDILQYLKNHSLQIFNYDFTEKYDRLDYDIIYDEQAGLYYILYENKRMYFSKKFNNKERVRAYCTQIMMEQDSDSPHRYLTEDFQVESGSVVVDAGVAEGNFALSVIEKVKKIYLVEPDADWAEALKITFAPYRDKVIIINKYLSNYVDESTVSIDALVMEKQIDFIKLDIEGEEYYALEGARNMIASSAGVKCSVCTYHHEFDYMAIFQLLQELGLSPEPSKGYMWFPSDKNPVFDLPTLRRGLIRAKKQGRIEIV